MVQRLFLRIEYPVRELKCKRIAARAENKTFSTSILLFRIPADC